MTKIEAKVVKTQSNKVRFENQINGYDIAQVDTYIECITGAYQAAYDEYNVKCDEYDKLMEHFKKLQTQEQSRPSPAVISDTIFKATVVTEKIIADAQAQAEKIKKGAYMDKAAAEKQAQKLLDDATADAAKVKDAAKKVLDVANAEAAMLKENSQSMVDNARAEVARIKIRTGKNVKQANVRKAQIGERQNGYQVTSRA